MSKSSPQESAYVENPPKSEAGTAPSFATSPVLKPRRRRISRAVTATARWLHIYASMLGLAATLFFSVTGLTLNHQDWTLGQLERTDNVTGELNPDWLRTSVETDTPPVIDRLAIVEHLRAVHRVRGALAEFRVEDPECVISFRGPGYSADAFVDLNSGRYQLTQVSQGLLAVLNDLHKGRDTGPVWSWVIDVSAGALALISVTGLILILTLKLKRVSGLIVAILGTLALVALVLYGVP